MALNLQEIVAQSFESVRAHAIRSMLTILGVVFGVAAVITMLSIGEGAKQETLEEIAVMGIHNVIIRAIQPNSQAEQHSDGDQVTNSPGLNAKDADAIRAECPFAEKVEVSVEHRKTAFYKGEHVDVPVIGVTPIYADIFTTPLKEGRFITDPDVREIQNLCVIGSDVKQKLFAFSNAIGEHVKLGEDWFTVVGVAAPKNILAKFSGATSQELNLNVYSPLTTAISKFGREKDVKAGAQNYYFGQPPPQEQAPAEVDQITVKLNDNADAGVAGAVLNRILSRMHNHAVDYTITVPEELLQQSQETQRIFDIVMSAIASISLIVGGIGIMNIMLASVLERTHEIGVRRALGATQRTVTTQFLSEAIILSMSGGMLGLLLGYVMTGVISAYAGWRTIISPGSLIISFSVSVATGIIFGYYPARQAALKSPIEALRYE